MNSLKKSFGARLKEIRISRNLNQEQLAEMVNMESRQISRIETGTSFTTIENIYKIAKALNVNVSKLFDTEHKKEKTVLVKEINNHLKKASQEQIELIYKFIQTIVY